MKKDVVENGALSQKCFAGLLRQLKDGLDGLTLRTPSGKVRKQIVQAQRQMQDALIEVMLGEYKWGEDNMRIDELIPALANGAVSNKAKRRIGSRGVEKNDEPQKSQCLNCKRHKMHRPEGCRKKIDWCTYYDDSCPKRIVHDCEGYVEEGACCLDDFMYMGDVYHED